MADFTQQPIEYIAESVMTIVNGAGSAVGGMLGAVAPYAQQAFIFLVMYTGLRLFFAYGDSKEALSSFFKIMFVSAILFGSFIGFSNFIIPGIHGTREFLANAISSNPTGGTIYASMDNIIYKSTEIATTAFNSAKIASPSTYIYFFYGLGVFIVAIVLVMVMAFVMLGAELLLLLIISIGPFFVVAFLFTSTRNFFFLWISAVFANIVLFVIGSFFIGLASNGITNTINDTGIMERITAAEKLANLQSSAFSKSNALTEQYRKESDAEKNKIREQRQNELNQNNCSTLSFFNSTCKEIKNRYDQLEKDVVANYRQRINDELAKDREEMAGLQALLDEPVNNIIYVGIILLLAIITKITFEIPSIAQTLSGGVGAGASAGALALASMQYLGRATARTTLGTAQAAKTKAMDALHYLSNPPKSNIIYLNQTLSKLNDTLERQNKRLDEVDALRSGDRNAWMTPVVTEKNDSNQKPVTINNNAEQRTEKNETIAMDRTSPPGTPNAAGSAMTNESASANKSRNDATTTQSLPPSSPLVSPTVQTYGRGNNGRTNVTVSGSSGRVLPSQTGNATSGAIDAIRREDAIRGSRDKTSSATANDPPPPSEEKRDE